MKYITLLLLLSLFLIKTNSQEKHNFKPIVEVKTSEIKSQGHSGTCWSFATTSFLESEILRMGGPELDLSEMYFVQQALKDKAQNFVMFHGLNNFSQGGQAHDVINVLNKIGMVTQNEYDGRKDTTKPYNHEELELTLKSLLNNYIKSEKAKPKDIWFTNINEIIENYIGELPTEVSYNNRKYSPIKFAKAFGIEKSNYIELTSYTHHSFYTKFPLEIPDNWSHDSYYNIPIDLLISTLKNALSNGYSIVWDGDISDNNFQFKNGIAFANKENDNKKEKHITQEDRQKAFLNWNITDDHLMHIVGMVKDNNGVIYFKTKNSWGTEHNKPYNGYLYMSEEYVRLHTVAILINKAALSKQLRNQLF